MDLLSKITHFPAQAPAAAPAAKPVPDVSAKPGPEKRPSRDEYTPEPPQEYTGMYHLGKDGDGKPKILIDAPEQSPEEVPSGGNGEETCTCSTDQVDREIETLKKKQAALEKQLANAGDDPKKQEQIQRQLDQITEELRRKDNDAYRRQHATFTEGPT